MTKPYGQFVGALGSTSTVTSTQVPEETGVKVKFSEPFWPQFVPLPV